MKRFEDDDEFPEFPHDGWFLLAYLATVVAMAAAALWAAM